jgi:hypothetical protein
LVEQIEGRRRAVVMERWSAHGSELGFGADFSFEVEGRPVNSAKAARQVEGIGIGTDTKRS